MGRSKPQNSRKTAKKHGIFLIFFKRFSHVFRKIQQNSSQNAKIPQFLNSVVSSWDDGQVETAEFVENCGKHGISPKLKKTFFSCFWEN